VKYDDTLYPVIVTNQYNKQGHVRIHYVGYGNEYDEWRVLEGLVQLSPPCVFNETYDLHQELAWEIRSTLTSSQKSDPSVKITIPFDKQFFDEGMASKGYVHKATKQITRYRIHQYSDLDDILGINWHFSGLNSARDYCFVILNTTEFHVSRRRPITHFIPDSNGAAIKTSTPRGYVQHFTFVRGDGNSCDFGSNSDIFT